MRSLLIISILLLLSISAALAQLYPFERADQHEILPVIIEYIPDSNFTFMSYALPNNPQCQLIHDNHLYSGTGPFLKIYELGEDGAPGKGPIAVKSAK